MVQKIKEFVVKGETIEKKQRHSVKHSKENALRLPEEKTEMFRTLKSISTNQLMVYKYEVLFHLMVDAGLRVTEAIQCRLSWFSDSEDGIAIKVPHKDRDLRNMKRDWIPKTQAGARTITFIRKEIGEKVKSYFISNPKGIIGSGNKSISRQRGYQLVKQVGSLMLPAKLGLHPHALRSTFANELVQGGVDLNTLCYLMGWDNLETARNYIKTSEVAATKNLIAKMRTNN